MSLTSRIGGLWERREFCGICRGEAPAEIEIASFQFVNVRDFGMIVSLAKYTPYDVFNRVIADFQ